MEERIRCLASLDRDPYERNLCVKLWSEDVIFWHRKLQDEFELLIPVEEFQRLLPDQWKVLSEEWHRQLQSGIQENAIVGIVDIPISVLTRDTEVELIPIHRSEEHRSFQKMLTAIAEGLWEMEDGRVIELDANDSPFVKMGMI